MKETVSGCFFSEHSVPVYRVAQKSKPQSFVHILVKY